MHNYKFGHFKLHDFHKDNKRLRSWDSDRWHKDGLNTNREMVFSSNARQWYLKFRLRTCIPPKRAFFGTEILGCKLHFRIFKSNRNCTITYIVLSNHWNIPLRMLIMNITVDHTNLDARFTHLLTAMPTYNFMLNNTLSLWSENEFYLTSEPVRNPMVLPLLAYQYGIINFISNNFTKVNEDCLWIFTLSSTGNESVNVYNHINAWT